MPGRAAWPLPWWVPVVKSGKKSIKGQSRELQAGPGGVPPPLAAWWRSPWARHGGQGAPVPGSRKNGEKTTKSPEPRLVRGPLPCPLRGAEVRGASAHSRKVTKSPEPRSSRGSFPVPCVLVKVLARGGHFHQEVCRERRRRCPTEEHRPGPGRQPRGAWRSLDEASSSEFLQSPRSPGRSRALFPVPCADRQVPANVAHSHHPVYRRGPRGVGTGRAAPRRPQKAPKCLERRVNGSRSG